MENIIQEIGYDLRLDKNVDFMLTLYLAMDCGFLSTLTDGKLIWKSITTHS